ncbi:MAG: hypothetical protein ACN4GR_07855 [Arenicellales bacterium]
MKNILFLLLSFSLSNSVSAELIDAKTIRSVWDIKSQSCNGIVANEMFRNESEERIKNSKVIFLKSLGYSFKIPQLPTAKETVIKFNLNDQSRGVVDNYILLSDQDLSAPFAAIVITTLPKNITTKKGAFATVSKLQIKQIRKAGLDSKINMIDGPHGVSLEMLIMNRTGSHCFPTSDFKFVAEDKKSTIGISRFSIFGRDLVEFTIIVPLKKGESEQESIQYARTMMDAFWSRFNRI